MAIFIDDFESQDFSVWTGETKSGGSTLEVIAGAKYCNSYGAHSDCPAWNENAYCYKTLVSSYTTVYCRKYVYFNTLGIADGSARDIMTFLSSGGFRSAALGFYNDSGTYKWWIYDRGIASTTLASPTISEDTWYCVEQKVVYGAGGDHKFYLDGVLKLDTAPDLTGWNMQTVEAGLSAKTGGHGVAADSHFDCVVVDSSYIGPISGVSIPVMMHHYGHHISKIIRG